MLGRLTAIPRDVLNCVWRLAVESRFGGLVAMAFALRRRMTFPSVLLGAALLACLYLAGVAMDAAFDWLGGWRWPRVLLALPAALFVGVVMVELYAAAILAALRLALQLGYDIGRAHSGAALALAAVCAGLAAGLRLWSAQADGVSSGALASAAAAAVLAALALWFARTYQRPAARGFRSFHVDLVEARRAVGGARHGA